MSKSKMVIVVRKDLEMRKGKLIAQGSHAVVGAILQLFFGNRLTEDSFEGSGNEEKSWKINKELQNISQTEKDWFTGEFTKVCVYVNSEEELDDIYNKAKDAGLNVCEIIDNGLTEFHGVKTKTCLAIGPDLSDKIDPITGNLKLL